MFVSGFFGGKFIWGRCAFYFNLVSEFRILGEILRFYFFLMLGFLLRFLTMVTVCVWFSCRIWAFGNIFSISFRSFEMFTSP